MTFPAPLADACPKCPPGDFPAVTPHQVGRISGSLCARYHHDACGHEWICWWNPAAVAWPLSREGNAA